MNEDKKSIINVYCIEDEAKKTSIGFCLNIIHEIKWSMNDKYVAACSSDFTVKVWRCKMLDDNYILNNDKLSICTLRHPSYVYSCEFVKSISVIDKTKFYLVSACHDGKVRLWCINTQAEPNTEDSFKLIHTEPLPLQKDITQTRFGCIFPNTVSIDDNSRIYCGDSNGSIHVWDLQIRETKVVMIYIKTIEEPEIIGDPVNCVHLSRLDKTKVIVHSRDNCLRLIENSSKRQKVNQ